MSFLFIIIHEFSHYLVAKKLGNNIVNFKIHPLGATLEIEDYEGLDLNDEILICVAGPLVNMIIAFLAIVLYFIYKDTLFWDIFQVNVVLGGLNLIPTYPLDGAKILRAILSKVFMYKKAHKMVIGISFIISIFIIILGVLLSTISLININIFFIGIFILYTSYTAKERTMYIVLDQIIKKNQRFKTKRYIENKDISIYYKEDFIKLLSMLEKNKFNKFYILNDKMELLYKIREDEVVEVLKSHGNMTLEEYYYREIKK